MTGKFLTVLSFEFKKMAANKAFVITTLLGPVFIVAITVIPALISIKATSEVTAHLHIGIYAQDDTLRENAEYLLVPAFEKKGWHSSLFTDEDSCRTGVLNGSLDGYLRLPPTFPKVNSGDEIAWYSKRTTDVGAFNAVEDVVSSIVVSARIAATNVDEVYVRSLVAPISLSVYKVSASVKDDGKETTENDFLGVLYVVLAFCMLIYMTVLFYGQQTGRSVVMEKSSKIVDILLSSVKSEELFFGKICGIGLAGILQYAVWIGFAFIAIWIVGPILHFDIPVHISPVSFLYLFLFFLGGYLLYSAMYAACGAASEDDQHMAQLSIPILFLLLIPLFIIQLVIQQPDSTLAAVLSYIPFTSPMIMMIRILAGSIPVWKILVSLGILVLSVFGVTKVASKIFRTGILMTGRNFSIKDIASWIRN